MITPVLNGERYLEDCIRSVLNQSYDSIEHVIVDGKSTDRTLDILSRYSKDYPCRIKFISEPDNGPGDGWNKGLKLASGSIFGCIGYDDICEPGAIQTVVDFFSANPEACFVHGEMYYIDMEGRTLGKHEVADFEYRAFANTARHISTPSAFYKRIAMERIGWCDSSGDDFDVMLRITREFRVYALKKVLSRLRLHDSVFRPKDIRKRMEGARDTFRVSRRYGGSLSSMIALRYYYYAVSIHLHIGPLGDHIARLINRLRRSPTAGIR